MAMMIEITPKGMRTGATAAEDAAGEKKRKVGDGQLRSPTSTLIQITSEYDTHDPDVVAGAGSLSSYCLTEELQFTDLEEYRKPRSEIKAGSGLPEMITAKPATVISYSRTPPAEKLPPAAELEEFFASAEKEFHKRFKDKYNYDVVNDTPLEGRFDWIQLKP